MTTLTSPSFSTPRNTIVLNGSNNSFVSMRIEDPKKASLSSASPSMSLSIDENDGCLKTMLAKIPEVNQYFQIVDKLGEGTFSKVYKAKLKPQYRSATCGASHSHSHSSSSSSGFGSSDSWSSSVSSSPPSDGSTASTSTTSDQEDSYALKYIIPIVKPARIAKELRFLRDLRGMCNVIPIKACFYNGGHTVLVMPIIEHDKFMDYFQQMDLGEIRDYMKNLFIALESVHSHGIIHRDIKPANFLYNRQTRRYALVDFGLSQSQAELHQAAAYFQHEMAHQKSGGGAGSSKSAAAPGSRLSLEPKVASKARANLTSRFKEGCAMTNQIRTKPEPVSTPSTSMASTISMIKAKRTHDEIENQVPKQQQQQDQSNKRRRMGAAFFETAESTIFMSPMVNSNETIFVPDTPVKEQRTPLGPHWDSNKFYSGHQPPVMNLQFTTPTKTDGQSNQLANKTPIKSNSNPLYIPETPPKTVQKNLMFSSSAKKSLSLTPAAAGGGDGVKKETGVHTFSTPKTRKSNTIKVTTRGVPKILQPELSNVADGGGGSRGSGTGAGGSEARPCECLDKAYICYGCLTKQELHVPRAGTPGFRAPEILLRCPQQTTKLDIWSAGVIFASLLSARYPFFRCIDDLTCLAEVVTVVGSSKVRAAAKALGKTLVLSSRKQPIPLGPMCQRLRDEVPEAVPFQAPDAAFDLLGRLLDPNPNTRFSATEALSHPFFSH